MSDFTLSAPNSPNFNERQWEASRMALAFANRPSTPYRAERSALARKVLPSKGTVIVVGKRAVALKVERLKALRPATVAKVTDAQIESAKVESVTDRKASELLGLSMLSVKGLRGACKARGFKRYSKLKRAELLTMLG